MNRLLPPDYNGILFKYEEIDVEVYAGDQYLYMIQIEN